MHAGMKLAMLIPGIVMCPMGLLGYFTAQGLLFQALFVFVFFVGVALLVCGWLT